MRLLMTVVAALTLLAQTARATDACASQLIATRADVTVSDGSGFRTQSFYQSKDSAAIRHIDDRDRIIAVEGPIGWARDGGRAHLGSDFYKLFALGHQYHALLLEFEHIASNVRRGQQIDFGGEQRTAASGDYPYGGTVHLVQGEDPARPAGLRFDFPEATVIIVAFLDWRERDGRLLPYRIRIDDGERTFDYRYTDIAVSSGSPLEFFDAVPAPSLDEVQVYRLHRRLLAAHCMGDAEMMASLSAPTVISANRGRMQETTNAELRARFASLFETLDYTEYHDLVEPVIEVSGKTGWIAANVRATGSEKDSGRAFDDQWAWIMTVRKIDGRWLHAANASNRLQ
jgi:ketosteroid isomerase-like protein